MTAPMDSPPLTIGIAMTGPSSAWVAHAFVDSPQRCFSRSPMKICPVNTARSPGESPTTTASSTAGCPSTTRRPFGSTRLTTMRSAPSSFATWASRPLSRTSDCSTRPLSRSTVTRCQAARNCASSSTSSRRVMPWMSAERSPSATPVVLRTMVKRPRSRPNVNWKATRPTRRMTTTTRITSNNREPPRLRCSDTGARTRARCGHSLV